MLRPTDSMRGDVVKPAVSLAMRSAVPLALALLSSLPSHAEPVPLSAVTGPSATGTWRTLEGDEITVAPCADGLCGTLSYIIIPK